MNKDKNMISDNHRIVGIAVIILLFGMLLIYKENIDTIELNSSLIFTVIIIIFLSALVIYFIKSKNGKILVNEAKLEHFDVTDPNNASITIIANKLTNLVDIFTSLNKKIPDLNTTLPQLIQKVADLKEDKTQDDNQSKNNFL